MKRYLLAAAALATIPHAATAADLIKIPAAAARPPQRLSEAPIYQNPVYNGRVAVMDGDAPCGIRNMRSVFASSRSTRASSHSGRLIPSGWIASGKRRLHPFRAAHLQRLGSRGP